VFDPLGNVTLPQINPIGSRYGFHKIIARSGYTAIPETLDTNIQQNKEVSATDCLEM
jgi:hypothetical protein